jgi:fructose-1,6-bisphosphatase/inositol monophosphatase family enzyme
MNFSQGLQYFCSCVACYRSPAAAPAEACAPPVGADDASLGDPVVGALYAPALDELFVGVRGQGATRNGAPLRVADVGGLADAVVAVSLGSEEATMARMLSIVSILLRRCRKLRLLGACGLDIANVAAGRLAGLVQRRVRAWDFAAARVILEEAGGRLLPVSLGGGRWDVLACAPALEAELLEILGDRA